VSVLVRQGDPGLLAKRSCLLFILLNRSLAYTLSGPRLFRKDIRPIGADRAFFRADLLRQLRTLVDEQMARKEATRC
jgi:hypothetical protein